MSHLLVQNIISETNPSKQVNRSITFNS